MRWTVGNLIEALQELDQYLEVITAKDDEGNGYNSLYFAPTVMYANTDAMGWELWNSIEEWEDEYGEDEDYTDHLRPVVVI